MLGRQFAHQSCQYDEARCERAKGKGRAKMNAGMESARMGCDRTAAAGDRRQGVRLHRGARVRAARLPSVRVQRVSAIARCDAAALAQVLAIFAGNRGGGGVDCENDCAMRWSVASEGEGDWKEKREARTMGTGDHCVAGIPARGRRLLTRIPPLWG